MTDARYRGHQDYYVNCVSATVRLVVLELARKLREGFTITEKWLKVSAFVG